MVAVGAGPAKRPPRIAAATIVAKPGAADPNRVASQLTLIINGAIEKWPRFGFMGNQAPSPFRVDSDLGARRS
jgi:hypothetical protein